MSYNSFIDKMENKGAKRPLPPSIDKYVDTVEVAGRSLPGTSVQLSNGAGEALGCARADGDGNWAITLDQPTKAFDVLVAVAVFPDSDVTSDPAQVTLSGRRPKLMHAYVSRRHAFGRSDAYRIDIYDKAGERVGTGYKINQFQVWECQFYRPLNCDERVVAVGLDLNGNTSEPAFIDVKTFEIEERFVGGLKGNGGPPNGFVLVMDSETNNIIETIRVDGDGKWSTSFAEALEFGRKVNIFTQAESGVTSEIIPVILATYRAFPLSIYGYESAGGTNQYIKGISTGKFDGSYTLFRDLKSGASVAGSDVAGVGLSTSLTPLSLNPGDSVYTVLENTTQSSYLSLVNYNQPRPAMPSELTVGRNTISGRVETQPDMPYAHALDSNGYLVGSGEIVGGQFSFPSSRPLQDGEIIAVRTGSADPDYTYPTSLFAMIGVNATSQVVINITVYGGTEIKGTGVPNGTKIDLFYDDTSEVVDGADEAVVTNQEWTITLKDGKLPNDTKIYAVGTYYDPTGVNPAEVTQSSTKTINNFKPEPPKVTAPYPDSVGGTENVPDSTTYDGGLSITIKDPATGAIVSPNTPVSMPAPRPGTGTWQTPTFGQPLTVGKTYNAYAVSDAGVESDATSFEVTKKVTQKYPPVGISQLIETHTQGAGTMGLSVRYYRGSTNNVPFLDFKNPNGTWSENITSGLSKGESVLVTQYDPTSTSIGESDPVYELVDTARPTPQTIFTPTQTQITGTLAKQPSSFGSSTFRLEAYSQLDGKMVGSIDGVQQNSYFKIITSYQLKANDRVLLYTIYTNGSNDKSNLNYAYFGVQGLS